MFNRLNPAKSDTIEINCFSARYRDYGTQTANLLLQHDNNMIEVIIFQSDTGSKRTDMRAASHTSGRKSLFNQISLAVVIYNK